jgi:hypothetical protein
MMTPNHTMTEDLLWGVGSLLIGIFSLWFTRKYPTKGRDIWLLDQKGYLGGITGIIAAINFFLSAFSHH